MKPRLVWNQRRSLPTASIRRIRRPRLPVEPHAGRDDPVGVGFGGEADRGQRPQEIEGVVGGAEELAGGDRLPGINLEIGDAG